MSKVNDPVKEQEKVKTADELSKELEQANSKIAELETQKADVEKTVSTLTSEKEQLTGEKESISTELTDLKTEKEKIDTVIAEQAVALVHDADSVEKFTQVLATFKTSFDELKAKADLQENQINDLKAIVEAKEVEVEVTELEKEVVESQLEVLNEHLAVKSEPVIDIIDAGSKSKESTEVETGVTRYFALIERNRFATKQEKHQNDKEMKALKSKFSSAIIAEYDKKSGTISTSNEDAKLISDEDRKIYDAYVDVSRQAGEIMTKRGDGLNPLQKKLKRAELMKKAQHMLAEHREVIGRCQKALLG